MDKKSFIRALFVAVAVAAFGAAACGGGAPKAPDAPTGASTAPPATPDPAAATGSATPAATPPP